jgi:hypothetical protein
MTSGDVEFPIEADLLFDVLCACLPFVKGLEERSTDAVDVR